MLLIGLTVPSVQAQKLQVIHNAPGASTADIYVLESGAVQATLDDIPFRGAIVLSGLPTGQSLEIRLNKSSSSGAGDTGTRLSTASLTLSGDNSDSFGQVFAIGDGEKTNFNLLTQAERSTTASAPSASGFVDVLIGHQSPDAGSVDLLTRGTIPTNVNGTRPDGLTEPSFSPQNNTSGDDDYYTMPFEDYIFRVGEDDNSAFLASVSAPLTKVSLDGTGLDDRTVTLLASGYVTPGDESNVSNPSSFALIAVPPFNATSADQASEASNADDNVTVLTPDSELQSLVINEYLADPGSSQDADGDGDTQDDSGEEFIEIVNITGGSINVSGFTIKEDGGSTYTFPSSTSLPGGEAATIFIDGADPTGIPGFTDTGSPQLENGTREDIILSDGNGKVRDQITYNVPNGGSNVTDLAPQNNQESATRFPDKTGDVVNSTQTSTGADFTPGRTTDKTALPVEFAQFNAMVDGQSVALSWRTLSEQNNARFEIQHRPAAETGWTTLGTVNGAGTTTQPQDYRFTTSSLTPGRHTFRLRQVDLDGTAHLGPTQSLVIETGETGLLQTGTNPVPAGQAAEFVLSTEQAQPVTVTLVDALGRTVRTVHQGRVSSPTPLSVATQTLSTGVYFLRAQGRTLTTTAKFSVVR